MEFPRGIQHGQRLHRAAKRFLGRMTNSSMFVRVFGVFGGLLMAMTLLYGALIIPSQKGSLLKVLYSQADTVSRSIILACSEALLTTDYGFVVEHNLQVLRNNQSIQLVVITPKEGASIRVTHDGWTLAQSGDDVLPLKTFDEVTYGLVTDPDGKTHYRYSTPIRFSGVSWGAMRIDFDTHEYQTNVVEMYRQLLFSALLALLVMLPIAYFSTLWLTRPIVTISKAAARVAQGDLNAFVAIERTDEIGQLSVSFNQMVLALQNSRTALLNYNLELERQVAERTHDLDELNRTLDQRVRDEIAKRKEHEQLLIHQSRLAAMGEMMGNIAHQWRQPLNALSLVMQNMRLQYHTGQLTEQSMERMQAKSEQLVQTMSTTIDDFRNFFKPGKRAEVFNLARAMRASVSIMEGVFINRNIVLTIECDESINLVGMAGEFSQVVLNLLSNAKDALIDSGQTSPQVWLRATHVKEYIQIDVEDNGKGIAPDIINKVFEPYFTTKEEGKGSGIGLYMSKMIVENNMNGRLEVANIAGGTRFTISLPSVVS